MSRNGNGYHYYNPIRRLHDTTNYCSVSTDPTPTITGTTGGVFSATPTGLTISASTGAIDLDASTAGTYTVQYITSTSTCADTATSSIRNVY